MIDGVIAVVGRPNCGKSTIFNRMLEERLSIVEDTPGVTRDRIYGDCQWLSKTYRLIDTGGIQLDDAPFQKEINAQVDIAIEEADVIIFIVNGQEGLTNDDEYIAKLLRKSKKPVIVAVNKIDEENITDDTQDKIMVGKLIENVKILAVLDANGDNVFADIENKGTPAMVIFAVPEEYHILVRKAMYLRTYEATLIPVPTNASSPDGTDLEATLSSEELKAFINKITIWSDIDMGNGEDLTIPLE